MTRRQLDSAKLPDNASRIFTTVDGASINGHHLSRLQSNEQIHDVVVGAYLKILAASKPETTRSFDTQFIHKLHNDTHQQIDHMFRMRRTNTKKDILAYDTLLLPVQKPGHFVLIVVQPRQHSINVFDSLRPDNNHTQEVESLRQYLLHVAGDRPEYQQWTVDHVAARDMVKQQGGVHCGIYVCMIAHCILTGLPISLLTPDNISSCRQHIAQCLLDNTVQLMTQNNVVLSTNTGTPATSEECKGDEEDNPHIQMDTDQDDTPP